MDKHLNWQKLLHRVKKLQKEKLNWKCTHPYWSVVGTIKSWRDHTWYFCNSSDKLLVFFFSKYNLIFVPNRLWNLTKTKSRVNAPIGTIKPHHCWFFFNHIYHIYTVFRRIKQNMAYSNHNTKLPNQNRRSSNSSSKR